MLEKEKLCMYIRTLVEAPNMNKLWDLKERQHRNCFRQKYQEVQAFKMFNDTLLNIFKVLYQFTSAQNYLDNLLPLFKF